MFALPHISWAFSVLVAVLISRGLYLSWRKSKDENLGYFLKVFILLSIVFCLASIPGIFLNSPFWVQVCYILVWGFILPIPFLLLKIVFSVRRPSKLKKFCGPVALFLSGLFLVVNILYSSPAKLQKFEQYFYWSEGTPIWLQMFGGAIIGFLTLLEGTFFMLQGFQSKRKVIRIRSFLIGGGIIILFLACISTYILFVFSSTIVVISGIGSLTGMIIVYSGIRLKSSNNKTYRKQDHCAP